MINNIKEKVKHYFQKESKLSIVSNILFLIFVILLIIPSTRMEILPRIQRLVLMSPSVDNVNEQKNLDKKDYIYQFNNMQGQALSLSEFKGEVIFLNVWATWCAPCIAEMPSIQQLYNDYKGKVKFILLTDESSEKVSTFMETRGFKLPVYRMTYRLPEKLYTQSIPTTYVISRDGKLVISEVGTAKWNSETVRSTLDKLIRKQIPLKP